MEEHITDEKQPATKLNQNLMGPSELTASVKEIEKNMLHSLHSRNTISKIQTGGN